MPEFLYHDDQVVVVSKPAGLLSVPGRGEDKQDCLWRRVQQHFPTARIVHRLDQATSGILVLALSADSHRHLSMQFQERGTDKRYSAVVEGLMEQDQGCVELPLRCDWERRPLQMVDHDKGKQATTEWVCTLRDPGLNTSRVTLYPITGRSHQLRVHMMAIGHPILGDRFYAQPEQAERYSRLHLHAEMLAFDHPETGERLELESPCPF
ncbi:pseudouridine synthase [Marinobacterium stanieri]|uniref:Dual-specificity RNA pseudouridine synthase RluA n=1 Tax=Marinobacterium stanieri TaxID=49186 RepID=A0A1N6RKQ0_9GAMM|nr:pseudouridine synthase [Marinobacterium stanieri]SIQ29292.1 ribosomal large subunit pseudouridine synthase A [Marinobacterium stanieri]